MEFLVAAALTAAMLPPAQVPTTPPGPAGAPAPPAASVPNSDPVVAPRASRPIGSPVRGRLQNGVQFPLAGATFVTWDPVLKVAPNRPWRRWATYRTVRRTLAVLAAFRQDHPDAARVLVGDLSRPQGGVFDRRFGGLGHMSHQNGLDVDVYYPRADQLERQPIRPEQVDRELAQDLVDRFVAAGAVYVFTGPSLDLRGPKRVVQELAHHDDHLHVRFRP
jgi:murein endopeptidase